MMSQAFTNFLKSNVRFPTNFIEPIAKSLFERLGDGLEEVDGRKSFWKHILWQ